LNWFQLTKLNWPSKNGPSSNLPRAFSKYSKEGPDLNYHFNFLKDPKRKINTFFYFQTQINMWLTGLLYRIPFQWIVQVFVECINKGYQVLTKLVLGRILKSFILNIISSFQLLKKRWGSMTIKKRMCSSYTGNQRCPFKVDIYIFDQIKTFSQYLAIVLQGWHLYICFRRTKQDINWLNKKFTKIGLVGDLNTMYEILNSNLIVAL